MEAFFEKVKLAEFRLLWGSILSALIIFSIIQLGVAFNRYIFSYQNEIFFKLYGYGGILFLGIFLLSLIFKNRAIENAQKRQEEEIRLLALNFLEGFYQGLNEDNNNADTKE